MQEQERMKVQVSQNVDSNYEYLNGIRLKQMKYLLWSVPFLIGIFKFPFFHHSNEVVDMIIRIFIVCCIAVLWFLLVRLKRFRNSKISDVEILEERIRFRIKKARKKNSIKYSKIR